MSKLNFKLYNEGNMVIFRILKQDSDVAYNEDDDDDERLEFESSNGFRIKSFDTKGIYENSIYIAGYEDIDKPYLQEPITFKLESEEEAEEYVRKALFAFKEWAINNYFLDRDNCIVELSSDNKYEV